MNRLWIAGLAALAVTAAACGGGHGSGPVPSTGNANLPDGVTAPYTGPASLADFAWGQQQLRGAVYVGPAHLSGLALTVVPRQQNAEGLIEYAQEASAPGSPLYRQWLTPQEIAQRFGSSQSDYDAVAQYMTAHGLQVAGWPQRIGMVASGSQSAVESALGAKLGVYEEDGQTFVAPVGTPHFSRQIPVEAIGNLITLHREHGYQLLVPPRAGSNQAYGYSPQQVADAFGFNNAYNAGYSGKGITIGIVATGPFDPADMPTYAARFHLTNYATIQQVAALPQAIANGLSQAGIPTSPPSPAPSPSDVPMYFPYSSDFQSPPPVSTTPCSGSLPGCNPEDGEAQIDTQQAAALAPGSTVNFYLAYNAADCTGVYWPQTCPTAPPGKTGSQYGAPQIGLQEVDAELAQIVADDKADVISISWGEGETQNVGYGFNAQGAGFEPELFAAMTSEGMAIFASSGDNGAAECNTGTSYLAQVCVDYPAGDPNVVSVGGVNAPINELGQLTAPFTAWGTTTSLGTQGSGGGVSTVFAAPAWQKNDLGATMREQPDVSMLADTVTGVAAYGDKGNTFFRGFAALGGTSVAAPQMAAMWALVLQANAGAHPTNYRLGNPAPLLYDIYKSGMNSLSYGNVFYDVVYGSNTMQNPNGAGTIGTLAAGPGYDEVTGLGVPYANRLITAVTSTRVP